MKKIILILILLLIPLITYGQIPLISNIVPQNDGFQGLVDDDQIIDTLATFGNWLVSDGAYFNSTTTPTDLVTPDMILSTGQTDEFCLTYESTGSTYEWQTCGAGGGGVDGFDFSYSQATGYGTGSATSTLTKFSAGLVASSTSYFENASTSLATVLNFPFNVNILRADEGAVSGRSAGWSLQPNANGDTFMDFDATPADGSSDARFRFFRNTNTSGNVAFEVHEGDGTATINTRLGDSSLDSYINAQGGDLGIGTASPTAKLDLVGVSGTYPTLKISHSAINTDGEFLRIGRTDSPTLRYHSFKATHSGTKSSNVLDIYLHDAVTSTSQAQVFTLDADGQLTTGFVTASSTATSTLAQLDTTDIQVAGFVELNSDVISDFVGTGLQLNGGSLETTLGTSIEGSTEITGNSIPETALNITNNGTADYYLSWQTGNALTWKVLPSGGGGGSPGGNDGEIQYNNNTAFGGLADFTYDGTDFKFASTTEGTKVFWGNDGDYIQQGSSVFALNAVGDLDLTVAGNINVGSKMILTNSATKPPLNIIARSSAPSSPSTADLYLDDGTNTLSARPSLKRYTGSVWEELSGLARTATSTVNHFIERPFNDENKFMFYTDEATTIQQVSSVLVGSSTPSFTFRLYHDTERMGAGNLILIATTTATSTPEIDSSFTDATIPASSFVWLTSTDKSGTIDEFDITISHKID